MGSRTITPPDEPSSPIDSGIRKRVCKACDRCRLKKSKCDGSTPCSRCKADNAICVFGERKKSHDKIYPKGYVEMLEHQQVQLVHGLQELYRRLQTGEGWIGAPLKESTRGAPLTHDILERLGALKEEAHSDTEHFEENLEALRNRLLTNGSEFMQRDYSIDANSDAASERSPVFETTTHNKLPTFTNPFAISHFPPTPPIGSPHPSLVKTSSPLKAQMSTSAPYTNYHQWQAEPSDLDTMEINMTYEPQMIDVGMQNMNMAIPMFHDPAGMAINPCLTMKDWQAPEEQMHRYFQGGVFT